MADVRLFSKNSFEYNEDNDLLGSGLFGSVYQVRLKTSPTKETVALKVLSLPQKLKKSFHVTCSYLCDYL
jgi:hypothetical protein